MGTADLTGSRAKLGRANEHLNIFDKEFRAFFAQKPKSVTIKFRREEGWYVAYVDPLPPVPMRLALIAGDCLNNLRIALDHLVWQLVLREDQEPDEFTSFPICKTEKQFFDKDKMTPEKMKRHRLHGLSIDGDAWAFIKDAQPFKSAQPENAILSLLAQMNNFDKHRTLLVQYSFPDEKTLADCIRWNPKFKMIGRESIFFAPSQEHPAKIIRYRFAPDGNPSMYVKGEFRVHPSLGDGKTQGSFDILRIICGKVQKILDEVAALPGVKNMPTPSYSFTKKGR